MLKQLYIKDFALISELNMPFHEGFSVITGETGAGKSIILGAIGLLLGQRADTKLIKQGCAKCVVEAHFDLPRDDMRQFFADNDIDYDAGDTILRRELRSNGKSRAFINDTPVTLPTMKALGEQLIDIHSQHQNLLLQKTDFQLSVVDMTAGDGSLMAAYRDSYSQYTEACRKLDDLRRQTEQARENADFMQFQWKELDDARLTDAGEQETLERESRRMSHSEEIKQAFYEAGEAMQGDDGGITGLLKNIADKMHNIEEVYPDAGELAARIDSCQIELKDIAQEISSRTGDIDFDPSLMENINMRLDTIYSLEKKHHVETVGELIELRDRLKQQLSSIYNGDELIEEQQKEVSRLSEVCTSKAHELSLRRKEAAGKVEQEMKKYLVPLGIPKVRFSVDIQPKPIGPDGADKVSFLFSANQGTPLQPVSQVASGGEIARVMLSLKAMTSGIVKLPTIIFDEIDTGVSGRVAGQMARIMRDMGLNHRQVISITHLPQIAALATTHYKVSKTETAEGTISQMTLLTDDGRVEEIAQMLSGSDVTAAAIGNAKELLNNRE